jgi:hypothetical protein
MGKMGDTRSGCDIMIDNVFSQVRPDTGRSLFADEREKYYPYSQKSSRSD